jgi:hypothetical protein
MNPLLSIHRIIIALVLFTTTEYTDAIQAKSLSRLLDPIIAKNEILQPMWGKKLDKLRLYSYMESGWNPIPYQIDKVDADDNYILSANTIPENVRKEIGLPVLSEMEKRKERIKVFESKHTALITQVNNNIISSDVLKEMKRIAYFVEDSSILDYNDELVFMARDAGNRAEPSKWLIEDAIELEIHDPNDGSQAWVYLFNFANTAPPRSRADYVSYDSSEDISNSLSLEIFFDKDNPMIIDRLIGKPPGKPPLPDILDRFKLYILLKPKVLFCANIKFDENNTQAFTTGFKDGPIRVIRRSVFWIVLGGIKLPFAPKMLSYLISYDNGLTSKSKYYIPVNLDRFLCKGSYFKAGLDLLNSATGAHIFSKDNPPGSMIIDGKMSATEKQLKSLNQHWIAGYLPNHAALISRMLYDKKMVDLGATLNLSYEDDETIITNTEEESGQHFVGHSLNLKLFPAGTYEFGFEIYTDFDFEPSHVNKVLDISDKPLKVRYTTLQ